MSHQTEKYNNYSVAELCEMNIFIWSAYIRSIELFVYSGKWKMNFNENIYYQI